MARTVVARADVSSTSTGSTSSPAISDALGQVVAAVLGALRGLDVVTALEQFMSQEEREVFDRLTAVMSLLEGHADVVMDAVGPDVIPSVGPCAAADERRTNPRGTEAFVRRLLGMESKLAQYRDGAPLCVRRRRGGRHGRVQQGLGRSGVVAQPG